MFKGKKILITGGTGSLGQALTKRLLKLDVDTIRILSRNESKQVEMESQLKDDRLRFFLGDVRDSHRLSYAIEDVDIVFHTAALKHVHKVEYNPFEGVKTNIVGTQNIIDACIKENVEIAIGVSTDKAVSPLNSYGATKLMMEKLFVAAGNFINKQRHPTKFITLRYGNVLGSSGSVVPKMINQIRSKQKVTITDPSMTRFTITVDEALDFILESAKIGKGSEIFLPKLKAYSVENLKTALVELLGDTGEEKIPIRPGEKIHEILINHDEMKYTWETESKYALVYPFESDERFRTSHPEFSKTTSIEQYSSDRAELLTISQLKQILQKSGLLEQKSL